MKNYGVQWWPQFAQRFTVLFAPINPVQNEKPRWLVVIWLDPQRGHTTVDFLLFIYLSTLELAEDSSFSLDSSIFKLHLNGSSVAIIQSAFSLVVDLINGYGGWSIMYFVSLKLSIFNICLRHAISFTWLLHFVLKSGNPRNIILYKGFLILFNGKPQ